MRRKWSCGAETETGRWSGWHVHDGDQINVMEDGTWQHNLHAPLNERNPDANHIHVKSRVEEAKWVLCSVKLDGLHKVNRREFCERISRAVGIHIPYT